MNTDAILTQAEREALDAIVPSYIVDEASAICDEYLAGKGLASGTITRDDIDIGTSVMALLSNSLFRRFGPVSGAVLRADGGWVLSPQ